MESKNKNEPFKDNGNYKICKGYMDSKSLIEILNARRQQESQKAIKFGELKTDKWYKITECSKLMESAYGKYFIMTIEGAEDGEIVKVFSIQRLIPEYAGLVGKYLVYGGKKEKENKSGEYYHDYHITKV